MKKDKKLYYLEKRKKTFKTWLLIIILTLPLIFTILLKPRIDNDLWYLLAEGKYIFKHGIYHIDPLSMHSGLQITVQNWLSASIFYGIYSILGFKGIYILMLLCYMIISYLIYKICLLISEDNILLSFLVSFITVITLLSYYIVTRPQIFSFINLLILIYTLELYIKKDNWKYLISIPIISLIQANMHASLWWMVFLFILPYFIDSFKFPKLGLQGYRKKPIILASLIGLIVGLINPYGIKAITFIFTSYGDKYMHDFIAELLPFSLKNIICINMFAIMIIVQLCYTLFRNGKVRIRYICLFYGTLLLGFLSIKGFSHFTLVSLFPLAYFFKDTIPNDFSDVSDKFMNVVKNIIKVFSIIGIIFMTLLLCNNIKTLDIPHEPQNIVKELQKLNIKNVNIYSAFNNGGYLEFYGYKPYIDPRAEVFLKKNNNQKDIFKEYYNLQKEYLEPDTFLKNYDFDYLMVEPDDILYNNIDEEKYILMYFDYNNNYKLYGKKELFTEEQLNIFTEKYKNNIVIQKKVA